MRAQRIKTGFHRLGLVLAAICAVVGAIVIYNNGLDRTAVQTTAIFAVAFYALADALGWIIAGFAGDGEAGK